MKKLLLTLLYVFCIVESTQSQCKITSIWGLPDELYRGRFKEADMMYGHPYTMFNKRNIGFDFELEVNRIRRLIIESRNQTPDGHIYVAYKQIAVYATQTRINATSDLSGNDRTYDDGESKLATWAKYNAFILLIGLDSNADEISSFLDRNAYKLRVLEAFDYMRYDAIKDDGEVIELAMSVVSWMQAYDLLKSCSKIPDLYWVYPTDDEDRNLDECSPRNKLRMFARELWWSGWGSPRNMLAMGPVNHWYGYKKNHGIIL